MDDHPASYEIAWLLITELARGGVAHFCICPGSRSTALALCAWQLESVAVSVHHDERSGGFFALGKALQSRRPTAIITTSGTAVAELLPAAVEASLSQVPLVLLSADRPRYLRGTGANQTIDQTHIFGSYVKQSLEIPVVDIASLPRVAPRLRQQVAGALAALQDVEAGPLHINVQQEKPFEPHAVQVTPRSDSAAPCLPAAVKCTGADRKRKDLRKVLAAAQTPAVVVGPNRLGPEFTSAVRDLARSFNMPLLADPLSGCRGCHGDGFEGVVASYEAMLQTGYTSDRPLDLIVRFGNLPVSPRLTDFLKRALALDGVHIYVNPTGSIQDEGAEVTEYVYAHPTDFCRRLLSGGHTGRAPNPWLAGWQRNSLNATAGIVAKLAQEQHWDGNYVGAMLQALPTDCVLFAGNSLPIRLIDLVGAVRTEHLEICANRGTSGIDGLVSTALGMAHGHPAKVVLLIGDISLLHDVGGLMTIRHLGLDNVVIVVLNNNGGGIFGRLPVARLEEPFAELFVNPHGMNFAGVAQTFDLTYQQARNVPDFRHALQILLTAPHSGMLEVQTDWRHDLQHAQDLVQRVADHLGE